MLDKLLERLIIRYYCKNAGSRPMMLIQGESNRTRVKVRGNGHNLTLHLYVAMIRNKYVRKTVLKASELYRETGDDPMEYMRKLFELSKGESDKTDKQ